MRTFGWFLVAVTLCPPGWAGDAQWVEIKSQNFSVITDAGERRGREVAERFEQMRVVYATLMTKSKVNIPIPLQIVAFRNSKEMRQVAPLFNGKPTSMAGLFQQGEDRCFIMLDMSVENPWQVVFHEYAHQLMRGTISEPLDPWFDEGFAEYFATIESDNKEARVGKIPHDTYLIMQQMGFMKVADLFRVQQNSATYNENGDHRTVFYAESAMTVHYLYDKGLVAKTGDYFNLVKDNGVPVEQAMQQAFGMAPPVFDKTLRDYISSGHFMYYRIPDPPSIANIQYSTSPVSQADAQAVLADIHLHSVDYHEQAAAEFEAVLKLDPGNAAALRGLGYAYLMKRDYQKAGAYFEQAAEKNPNDARVQYYSAVLMQQQGGFSDRNPERLQKAVKALEASTKLDPTFADAYNLLGFAYRMLGKYDQSVQATLKAINLNPSSEQYRFNMAATYLDMKRLDEATAILKVLKNSSDQRVAFESQGLLAQLQAYRQALASDQVVVEHAATVPDDSPEPANAASAMTGYLKGKLVGVDCSTSPSALVTVLVGSKIWKLRAADRSRLIVVGADNFSCDWKDQKVGVNYRETGERQGDIVSLEVE